jgi:hypothetical protein
MEEVYTTAIEAYRNKDLSKLQNIKITLPLQDNQYWLYLAQEPELFYSIMEIESYLHSKNKLFLHDVTRHAFSFKTKQDGDLLYPLNEEGLPIQPNILSPNIKIFTSFRTFLNTNINQVEETLSNYSMETILFYRQALKIGAVVSGIFAYDLVCPTYDFNLIDPSTFDFRNPPYAYNKIPGLYECIKVFYARHISASSSAEANVNIDVNLLFQIRQQYEYYDLESELIRLRQHLLVWNNYLYYLEFLPSTSIHLYITDQKQLASLINLCLNKIHGNIGTIQHTENCIIARDIPNLPTVYIMKLQCSSIEDIIASLDLPALGVVITEKGIFCSQAYILCVEYGINIVIPRGRNINPQLIKCYDLGLIPYFPRHIITMLKESENTSNLKELYLFRNKIRLFENKDYSFEIGLQRETKSVYSYANRVVSQLQCNCGENKVNLFRELHHYLAKLFWVEVNFIKDEDYFSGVTIKSKQESYYNEEILLIANLFLPLPLSIIIAQYLGQDLEMVSSHIMQYENI